MLLEAASRVCRSPVLISVRASSSYAQEHRVHLQALNILSKSRHILRLLVGGRSACSWHKVLDLLICDKQMTGSDNVAACPDLHIRPFSSKEHHA